ncbi:MAG: DUF167 domain-containing protein [Gammaproteobacteria bacterium]
MNRAWRAKIRVIPRAKRLGWGGHRGDRLVVRLTAPPADGKANAELRRFLADEFGVPLSAVTIEQGAASRDKTVCVAGPTRLPQAAAGPAGEP